MTEFLNLAEKPYRLTMEQTAWKLGFPPHEISILIAKGLLKPLGHPAHNGQKFFLSSVLEELRRDERWFSKASDAIAEYWRRKNSRKGETAANEYSPQFSNGKEEKESRVPVAS